jgi:tRNA-Thr(GGU) m(6)t(6)A37 methyltransferase TsaA
MSTQKFFFHEIGIIRSPHKVPSETPIQPVYSKGIKGSVILQAEYTAGIMDLERFSHIFLIYYFHKSKAMKLILKPYLEDNEHGVFATRAPHRPNPIGFSVVKLRSIEKNILQIEDVDILDGTPLLDIKPYVKRFDSRKNVRSGWQEGVTEDEAKARGRRNYKG